MEKSIDGYLSAVAILSGTGRKKLAVSVSILMLEQIGGRIRQSCIKITLKTVKRGSLIRMVSPTFRNFISRGRT